MKAKCYTVDGKENGFVELPSDIFEVEVNQPLVHFVIKSYLANARQGTAKTKGRSEVSGGGVKPFKQKGTGRARAGSNTSPVWVRGGKAFGTEPRDYGTVIPKKMRRAALKSAFSSCAMSEGVLVLDKPEISEPKTSKMAGILGNMDVLGKKNLLLIDSSDRDIYLSGRNIKNVQIKAFSEVNAYDVVNADCVVFAGKDLVEKLAEVVK